MNANSFEVLAARVEKAVSVCLADSTEPIDSRLRRTLVPLASSQSKEVFTLRKATLEYVFKKIGLKISNKNEKELCEQSLALTILEEIMETQPLDVCEDLFNYLEQNKQRLLVDLKPTVGKGLILLRVCNELVRRTSKSNNNGFRGRILIFLSNTYALGEVSGVNKGGECNVENITTFHANPDDVDAEFYNNFWRLQTYFSNPLKMGKDFNLEHVLNNISLVVNRFQDIILQEKIKEAEEHLGESKTSKNNKNNRNGETNKDITSRDKKRKASTQDDDPEETLNFAKDYVKYFPKYLTSHALFNKEISDRNFRRTVLVQILIILQYLTGLFPDEQARIAKAKKPADSNPVQLPVYAISEAQQTIIMDLWEKIFHQIEEITPNGTRFAGAIRHILAMEKRWNFWKYANNCAFDKITEPRRKELKEKYDQGMRKKAKLIEPLEPIKFKMGSEKLTTMWEKNKNVNGLSILADKSRPRSTPEFHKIYEKIKADNYPPPQGLIFDPAESVEEKEIKDKGWQ
ncbi:2991_t:CDS:10 [Diversispora eburnea]|uniref:2991_t:CDS:1 n=1 Tax=Diversispora eburnea TaxID=1213867 RepID=A0A9N9F735_9GLOM|nr:2991_t:CDS:10 [Diversispora eburnea]